MNCSFCPSGYLGGMAAFAAVPVPKPRQATLRNEKGWHACDRLMCIQKLWSLEAQVKGLVK